MTHTEKVHVVFGVLAAMTGALALWHAFRPSSNVRHVWPVLAFLIGFCLFIPVEAQTRTYVEVTWWATILSVVPDSPQYWLDNWFAKLASWHVVQHKIGGLMIMVVGVVEAMRGRGRLTTSGWRFVLPTLLVGIGIAFGVHGGGSNHLPFRSEQVHHHVFGVAFVIAGLTQGLVELGRLHGAWRGVWALLVLLVGINISVFYRLDSAELPTGGHQHASTGTGLR